MILDIGSRYIGIVAISYPTFFTDQSFIDKNSGDYVFLEFIVDDSVF